MNTPHRDAPALQAVVDDRALLDQHLLPANVPVLLAMTYQLTGDRHWLGDRYRPGRAKGMDENLTGDLPPEVQAEVRAGAAEAITAWAAGRPVAVPAPRGDELVELLRFVNGEDVPPEYEPMMAELLGTDTDTGADTDARTVDPSAATPPPADFHVLVIGAGVSGMLTSLRLTEQGIAHTVVEKNPEVGGGWWENTYPGCGVDTPSYLYSYSFHPHRWSTFFGKRDEVEGYLSGFADTYALRDHIRFGVEATDLAWDEATSRWSVTLRAADGSEEVTTPSAVVTAVGVLNRPKLPAIPGLDSFEGTLFHSARWPEGLDLEGRRVAVVGAGASAMQIVPAVAATTGSLTIFQRSPQWIAPNSDYFSPVDPAVHWLIDHVPFYGPWYRAKLSWIFNDRVHPTLTIDPDWDTGGASINAVNDGHRRFYTRYIEEQLAGRDDLVAKSLPDYPPFGKRMLLDNGWYRTLLRDDVELVTEGVAEVTPTGLVDTAGRHHEVDVIIMATGFESTRYLFPMDITGREGRSLAEVWGPQDAQAYLGMTVPGFPNLFITCGPTTGLGHGGSFITVAEWQVRYVVELLTTMLARGASSVDCRPEVDRAYTAAVDAAHAQLVWVHPQMDNWYRNPAGRVVAVSPWRIVDYYTRIRHVDPTDFSWEGSSVEEGQLV